MRKIPSLAILSILVLCTSFATAQQAVQATRVRLSVQIGHGGAIDRLAASPDGRLVVSHDRDREISILWSVRSGRQVATFSGKPAAYPFVGGRAVVFTTDSSIAIYDPATGTSVARFLPGEMVFDSAAASGGNRAAVLSWRESTSAVTLLSGRELEIQGTLTPKDARLAAGFASIALSDDGAWLATGSSRGELTLWDAGRRVAVWSVKAHTASIEGIRFSPGGDRIYSHAEGGQIAISAHDTGSRIGGASAAGDARVWLDSAAGTALVAGAGGIDILEASSGKSMGRIPGKGFKGPVTASTGGTTVFASEGEAFSSLDPVSGSALGKFSGSGVFGGRASFASGGSGLFIVSSRSGRIMYRDALDFRAVESPQWPGEGVPAAVSDDLSLAVARGGDGSLRLVETATGSVLVAPVVEPTGAIIEIARLGSGYGFYNLDIPSKSLDIQDARTGKVMRSIRLGGSHVSPVFGVSPDGSFVVAFSLGMLGIKSASSIWDAGTGKKRATLDSSSEWPADIAVSPDGSKIAVATLFGALSLYDSAKGSTLRRLVEGETVAGTLSSFRAGVIAFSRDGMTLFAGSHDGLVRSWDVSSGEAGKSYEGHIAGVASIATSPDGKRLLTASRDGTARLWDLGTGEALVGVAIGDDGKDYVAWTPEGYFTGTDGAIRRTLNIVSGSDAFAIDSFFEKLYRPDLVGIKAGGGRIEGATARVRELVASMADAAKAGVTLEILDAAGRWVSAASYPVGAIDAKDGYANVRVAVEGGASGPRLYANGKLLGEGERGLAVVGTARSGVYRVPLVEGKNELVAIASGGVSSEVRSKAIAVEYVPPAVLKPSLYAIVVGIDEYLNGAYSLRYSVEDAVGFADSLASGAKGLFGTVEVSLLLDGRATKPALVEAFGKVAAKASPQDVFVLYYAGHGIAMDTGTGGNDFHYVLADVTHMTSVGSLAANGLSSSEVRALLAAIPAAKQALFIDACNSGSFAEGFVTRGAAEETALVRLARSAGTVIIASTTSEQQAIEAAELGHGLFTYLLLQGIAKGRGEITAKGLGMYIEERLPGLALKYRGSRQYPVTFAFGQDFPLGLGSD